jgi:hypothetical protein
VDAEGPVYAGAIDAKRDAQVDGRPLGIGGATIAATLITYYTR